MHAQSLTTRSAGFKTLILMLEVRDIILMFRASAGMMITVTRWLGRRSSPARNNGAARLQLVLLSAVAFTASTFAFTIGTLAAWGGTSLLGCHHSLRDVMCVALLSSRGLILWETFPRYDIIIIITAIQSFRIEMSVTVASLILIAPCNWSLCGAFSSGSRFWFRFSLAAISAISHRNSTFVHLI